MKTLATYVKQIVAKYSKWFGLMFVQLFMMGCTMNGQKWAYQSFDFDYTPSEVDVLDWQYGEHGYVGDQHQSLPRAPKDTVDRGLPVGGGGGMSGGMPVGDFLYVKWRVKATGEILEDKVDLRNKLPRDMNNHGIHFIVIERQLYIFLVPPTPPHTPPIDNESEIGSVWPAYEYGRATKNDPMYQERINKMQIYPDVSIFDLKKGSQVMNNKSMNFDQKRLEFGREAIRLYGDKIPATAQKGILDQRVLVGMSPYEAKLAAGAFYFKVEADPKHWPPNANPLVVIDKQSIHPDESKIWMTFETETQYPGEGKQRFTVYFFNGKAQDIQKLSSNGGEK